MPDISYLPPVSFLFYKNARRFLIHSKWLPLSMLNYDLAFRKSSGLSTAFVALFVLFSFYFAKSYFNHRRFLFHRNYFAFLFM